MTRRLTCVSLIASALVTSACAPRPYSPPTYSAPARPAPTVTEETKPHGAMRLVSVTPALTVPDTKIMVDRFYTEKTEMLVTSMYTTRSARYIPKGSIVVLDRDVQFGFGLSSLALSSYESVGGKQVSTSPLGLSLLVRNGSGAGVVVDWNAVTLIDGGGRAYPVLHRGVKMAERASVVAPSTIPPGAILEDFVYPRELVSFSGGRYATWVGERFFERMRPGDLFSLYLPVKRGTETVEYQFKFEMLAPETETAQPASKTN